MNPEVEYTSWMRTSEPQYFSIRSSDGAVSPETVIAAWRGSDGREEVLDDASVSIAGLVRSKVGFAGDAGSGPAASRIIRWQVPLRSTDPPGIDPARLPRNDAPAANR